MILIAPDKFKGTFSAQEICAAISGLLREGGYSGPILCRPLSDGGEGIASTLMPRGKRVAPGVYEDTDGARLVVSSEIVGFANFGNPMPPLMQRSSVALGLAVEPGVPTTLAIGGTATSDGGAGFLQGLGAEFYNPSGQLISKPITPALLPDISSADLSALSRYDLRGIVDVKARLIPDGNPSQLSALSFASQKGLDRADFSRLENNLRHLQHLLGGESPFDGAGGGLGYALASVVGAPCRLGGEVVLEKADIPWAEIFLVITGEGSVDLQTSRGGKLVDTIWREASRRGIPTVIAYGRKDEGLPYPTMIQIEDTQSWHRLGALLESGYRPKT